jgi:hypothetical protein
MADNVKRVTDMLSAPMEQVIVALGTGIARAQRELDRYAIDAQREIDEDPMLSEVGLQATFYQIPRAELELTIAIAIEENNQPANNLLAPRALVGSTTLQNLAVRQIHFQPVNASYTNQFNYDVNASSKLKLTVVPVPPPGAESSITPRMLQEAVMKIASPNLVEDKTARLSVNFNGRAGIWVVLQYRLVGNDTQRIVLVVIDDQTGQIIKTDKGS